MSESFCICLMQQLDHNSLLVFISQTFIPLNKYASTVMISKMYFSVKDDTGSKNIRCSIFCGVNLKTRSSFKTACYFQSKAVFFWSIVRQGGDGGEM